MKKRYSAILGNLSNTCDRFLSSGYKGQPTKEESWIDSYGMENFGKLIVMVWLSTFFTNSEKSSNRTSIK